MAVPWSEFLLDTNHLSGNYPKNRSKKKKSPGNAGDLEKFTGEEIV